MTRWSAKPYSLAAREAAASAAQYRQAQDWPHLLSLRLRTAAHYTPLSEPFLLLINDYLPVVWATRSQLPELTSLAAHSATTSPAVRADAVVLDRLQSNLVGRLEVLAARRSIRIRTRRRTRATLFLTPLGPCVPWFGPKSIGRYTVSPLPRRARTPSGEWSWATRTSRWWPRQTIVLSRSSHIWRPVALADLLVQLGVFMAYNRRRAIAIHRAGASTSDLVVGPQPEQQAGMMRAAQELGHPNDAVSRAQASGAVTRGYSRLLVWLLRDELRSIALAPDE